MRKVNIAVGELDIHAELRDTLTADAIYQHLPFTSSTQTWGDEIYFVTPISNMALEPDVKDIVDLGELAFWVEGNCIAIGFGPTPISQADEIRLAVKTNIWADSIDDLAILKSVQPGQEVIVTAIES